MPSNGTFEDRVGKYKAGDALLQSWADYNPSHPLITKAANTAFIVGVDAANLTVTQKKQIIAERKETRSLLCFTEYDDNQEIGIINPDCAEQRMVRVLSYLTGTLPDNSPTIGLVNANVKKIRPNYKGATSTANFSIPARQNIVVNNVVTGSLAFNIGNVSLDWNEVGGTNPPETVNPGEETTIIAPSGNILIKNDSNLKAGKIKLTVKTGKGQANSPMEKTFASVGDYLTEVITYIQGIGGGIVYNPPDPKLTVAQLTALRDQIRAMNVTVAEAMGAYGDANFLRKKLYNGNDGMVERIRLIKNNLASFPDGKKSMHFKEFSQAIKGT